MVKALLGSGNQKPDALAVVPRPLARRVTPDLPALLEEFLTQAQMREYSPNTVRAYRQNLGEFLDFASNVPLVALRPLDIRGWLVVLIQRGNKPRSLARKLSALRSFFDYLVLLDVLAINPARHMRRPKFAKPLPRFLSEQGVTRLIEAAEIPRDRAMLETLYATGCRVSELVGMQIEDICWSERTVKVMGKGRKERLCPLNHRAVKALRAYVRRRDKGPVFIERAYFQRGSVALQRGRHWCAYWRETVDGKRKLRGKYIGTIRELPDRESAWKRAKTLLAEKVKAGSFAPRSSHEGPIDVRTVRRVLDAAAARAGLEHVFPHQIRHSFATHLLDHGADLISIKELLGHATVTSTEIYTHVSMSHLREVFERCHPRAKEVEK